MYIFAIVNPNTMKTGTIFSVEEFAIHDGPGIRTTIFLKGCPLRCAWCHNPEGISPQPQYMIKKGVKSICGYQIAVEELVTMIEKNRSIYTLNRGGVTLTGGEPLFQPDFVIELLRQLPDIHTAIETSGYANTHIFNEVTSLADLILFDIKHTDPEMHRKYTGVDNAIILENAGTTERDGRNDAKRLCTNVVTVSDEVKPKKRKMQGKAEYSRRTVCKSLPKKM